MLGGQAVILCDAGAYPIARWGAERARAIGVPVRTFPHHDAGALEQRSARLARRPATTDRGHRRLLPALRRAGADPAPMPSWRGAAAASSCSTTPRRSASWARRPTSRTLRHRRRRIAALASALTGRTSSSCSSLAKGFGVPVAVLAGERALIERFRARERDPRPLQPAVGRRRSRRAMRAPRQPLARRVAAPPAAAPRHPPESGVIGAGLRPSGQLPFPVQTFLSANRRVAQLYEQLLSAGIHGLLTTTCKALTAGLTLVVTARHGLSEIERAARVIARAAAGCLDRNTGDAGIGHTMCRTRI